MGPGILSTIGVGVWRKAPEAFPDSNTTLDTCQSANMYHFSKSRVCPFNAGLAQSLMQVLVCPVSAGFSFKWEEKGNRKSEAIPL